MAFLLPANNDSERDLAAKILISMAALSSNPSAFPVPDNRDSLHDLASKILRATALL